MFHKNKRRSDKGAQNSKYTKWHRPARDRKEVRVGTMGLRGTSFPFPSCLQPYLLLSRPRQVLSNYCGLQEPDNPELLRPVATRASNSISYLFKLPPLLSLDELNLQSRNRTQIENKHMDIKRGLEERGRLGLPYTHYYV